MIKYPLKFEVLANSPSGMQTPFSAGAEDFPEIVCAIPPSFNGPGGGYSPEDLYALAVVTCFIATFKVIAEKSKFTFSEINGKGLLTVTRGVLEKLEMSFVLRGVSDEAKAREILGEAEKYCLVANAIKSQKSYNYSILSE